jgi:hypothetical protein
MLRLLAQNDESYEDIAALKGVSVEQVRAEVKAALAAAAAEQEPQRPQTTESRAEFPENPSPPPAEKRVAAEPPAPAAPQPQRRAASLPPQRRRLLLFAAGALAIVAVVLILIAVLGEDSGGGAPTTAQAGGEAAGSANAKLTQAKLEPVDGGDAEGQAVFGRLKKKIILLVEAVGLDPTTKGSSYTVWLYKSPKLALRIGSVKVGKSGGLRAPFQLTPEIFGGVLGRVFNQIYISRTDDAEYARAVEVAEQQKKLPPYSGETVLRGEVTGPVIKKPSG